MFFVRISLCFRIKNWNEVVLFMIIIVIMIYLREPLCIDLCRVSSELKPIDATANPHLHVEPFGSWIYIIHILSVHCSSGVATLNQCAAAKPKHLNCLVIQLELSSIANFQRLLFPSTWNFLYVAPSEKSIFILRYHKLFTCDFHGFQPFFPPSFQPFIFNASKSLIWI